MSKLWSPKGSKFQENQLKKLYGPEGPEMKESLKREIQQNLIKIEQKFWVRKKQK